MSIINNIGEVQEFFPAALSLDIKLISPVFPDAIEKYIKPFLGKEELDALTLWYENNKEPEDAAYTELLKYVQRALIRFAIFMSVSQLDLKMTNAGFSVTSNPNVSPASPERVRAFKESMEKSGWDAIELLLTFLEENKADYTAWSASDAYTLATKNFVNSALEFDKTVNIDQSRLAFYRMRNTIDRVEYLKIEPVISKDLADAIKAEIIADNVSVANQAILPSIKKAVIFFTAAEDIDKKYQGMAEHYLVDVKKIINATPDDYPLYRDSGIYVVDATNYPSFTNTVENTNFIFGAKG